MSWPYGIERCPDDGTRLDSEAVTGPGAPTTVSQLDAATVLDKATVIGAPFGDGRTVLDDPSVFVPRTAASDVHDAETRLVPGGRQRLEQGGEIDGGPRVDAVERLVGAAPLGGALARPQGPFPSVDLGSDTVRRVDEISVGELTPFWSPDLDRTTNPGRANVGTESVAADRGQDTAPSINGVGTSALISSAPLRSDEGTRRAARVYKEPASTPPGSKSSDPPTVFVRRAEGHIELPPGSVVDEYEIDHRLGAGAMGEVYAARHVKLGKRVAIKVISPRLSRDAVAIERFEQEARTLAQMRHPGLVDVVGFGELADGRAYFAMEYLAGESLFGRLARGRLAEDEALDVFDQMARALEAAHRHGVIHRDLKPENTFLTRVTNEQRPIVKLLDFGLAKLAVEVDRRSERTQSGIVIGTAMYLSPEQAHDPNVDHRTDIYALGCIGYEVFLGRPPFEDARTVGALIAAHVHETPPMPRSLSPRIPPQLDLLLFAMLAKDPAYRPTLAQVREVIAGVRSPAPIPATPPPPVSPGGARAPTAPAVPRSSKAMTFVIAGGAMIAGVVIGAAALGSRSSGDERATSGVPTPAEDRTGAAPAAMPTPVTDAGIAVVVPSPSIDAGAIRPHQASSSVVDAGSVNRAPIDAESVMVVASPVDAWPQARDPEEIEIYDAAPSVLDASVTTATAPVVDAAVRPATAAPPVHRPSPPPATKKPAPLDRYQTVNPFPAKPKTK